MNRYIIFCTALLLMASVPSFAQIEGSIKADGAWNFKENNTENADFRLKYKGDKFYIGTTMFVGHSYLPSSQTTAILDAKKDQNEFYKGEEKTMNPRKFNAGAGLDFGFIFNPSNFLDASLGYGYNGVDDKSTLKTERYNSDKSILNGTQLDTAYIRKHSITSRIAYVHKFDSRPDARLDIILTGLIGLNMDANRRITSGNFYSKSKNYATYSSLNDFDSKLSASYDDIFRFEQSLLKLKAGFDYSSNQDLDGYSAETYVDEQWRDSTNYRQSYFYNANSLEPFVNLTYSVSRFDFFVKERVQIYHHALMDELEEKTTKEDLVYLFDKFDPKNLISGGVVFKINDRNHLAFDYSRTIARPDYKKLCPTLTIGKSEGEYFIGNTDLLPETIDKLNLGYTYSKGIFVTKFDINYRDKRNTAEKVIDLEKAKDISDPMVKTIFTWINNKRQESLGAKLDFRMNGKDVKAEIWAGCNYDMYWKDGKVDKNDFNYELGTSVDVFLNETTKLSSSLVYVSAKQSAFNLKGEDILANLRFSKTLTKGLALYVELRDIVDKNIYEETWNAEMNYLKVVTTTPMHRTVSLGINYVF